VQSLAQDLRVPDVYACVACGHPPLYYALAAAWSRGLGVGGWVPLELGLQWLSLLLFFGFVVVALLILRSCTQRPATLRLAAALIVFWPSSVINSVRVHNDALASLLMLTAMYFIAEWDRRERDRDFYAALIASALALLTKSSGYAVAATLVLFAVLRLRSTGLRRESLRRCAVAIVVLAGVGFLAVGLRQSRNPTILCQKVLGHACDGRYVPAIPDSPRRFVSFDVRTFLRRIDTVPADPFPNRLAKSALFGVTPLGEELGDERHQWLATLLSGLLLAMGAFCLVALPALRGARLRDCRAYWVSTVVLFAFLVAFRIRAPNEFHEDFRHIFPALVPLCLGYATAVERVRLVSRGLHFVGVAVALLMITSSAAFFLRLPGPDPAAPGEPGAPLPAGRAR
jgi:4-amino-4-deoxy-L-arabinose transferase-like glycosyltransferase